MKGTKKGKQIGEIKSHDRTYGKSKKNKNIEITEILWQIKARTTVKKMRKKMMK